MNKSQIQQSTKGRSVPGGPMIKITITITEDKVGIILRVNKAEIQSQEQGFYSKLNNTKTNSNIKTPSIETIIPMGMEHLLQHRQQIWTQVCNSYCIMRGVVLGTFYS